MMQDIELAGPGEFLDAAAPDFPHVLNTVTRDIVFPSDAARDKALAWQVADHAYEPNGERQLVSTGTLRLWTAGNAVCAWTDSWAGAVRKGDTATEKASAEMVLGARHWPAVTDTDPELGNESEFAWLPDLERAIRTSDTDAAAEALSPHSACMPGLAPELGMGEPR